MDATIPPVELPQDASVPGTPGRPISAFRALQIVNVLMAMEVSSQVGAATPIFVEGERPCWSVPVWLSFPDCGRVGQVGTMLVDALTGEVMKETETLREVAENAKRLAERPE